MYRNPVKNVPSCITLTVSQWLLVRADWLKKSSRPGICTGVCDSIEDIFWSRIGIHLTTERVILDRHRSIGETVLPI